MKFKKTLLIAILPTLLFAGSAWAQSWNKSAKPAFNWGQESEQAVPDVAGVSAYTANFKLQQLNSFSGPCPDDFADQCFFSCTCFEFDGSGSGTAFGKAPSGNVGLDLTVDFGDFAGDPDGGCAPTYGALFVTGSKDAELLDLSGTTCESFGSQMTFIGGFDFHGPGPNSCDGAGTANFKGLKLKLKGKYRKIC